MVVVYGIGLPHFINFFDTNIDPATWELMPNSTSLMANEVNSQSSPYFLLLKSHPMKSEG
jgi:hypothetical protein